MPHSSELSRCVGQVAAELGLFKNKHLFAHNLALLEFRTDIVTFGFLHKIQFGEAHAYFDGLFPKELEIASAST